ncbi:MAG: hypothetical protein HXS53_07840 [Theionarchaea archaeon]|nr:hypothetical protein [Theionarchaea archaeon]
MIEVILAGSVLTIIGILALFVPSLTKIINLPLPVSDKVKALIVAGVGIAFMVYGLISR